jgi:hypothetical protein
LWHSYITWARQIRKFAYLVLPVRLLGFPTGHQRVATCQSPGARKGPPGCAGTGWAGTGVLVRGVLVLGGLIRVVLVGALLERYVLEVALLERTEVDRALWVRA